jgi:phosphoadenosine phosphosulfate reductase
MSLSQLNFESRNKIEAALRILQSCEPDEGYYLAFSGGKDSVVIYHLAVTAGVKFDAHYNVTGIDPPELVRFIRKNYPDIIYEKPKENIWHLVERKGLPRRNARFCCEYLKEHTGGGRIVITGIRRQESWKRRRRPMIEFCNRPGAKSFVHPIIDWSEREVWEYIRMNNLPYCSLYDEGFKRLGCVLCPMTTAKNTRREKERWPKLADAWYRACERFFAKGSEGTKRWDSAQEMFEWWLSRKSTAEEVDDGQYSMFI